MKIRYFAWVRERTGIDEETIDRPDGVNNATELMTWLSKRGENFQAAFEEPEIIRVAYDQLHGTALGPRYDKIVQRDGSRHCCHHRRDRDL